MINIMFKEWYKTLTKEQKIGYKIMYPKKTYKWMYERMINRFGLILKPPLIFTEKQCIEFKKNQNINPISKKKIKKNGKVYQKLKDVYERTIKYSK